MMKKFEKTKYIIMICKYLYALVFPAMAVLLHHQSPSYIIMAIVEIAVIALISNLLCGWHTWVGYTVNVISLLLMNAQFLVLYFGSTFVSLVMLDNLAALEDISGNFAAYAIGIFFVLLFTFLPINHIELSKKSYTVASITAVTACVCVLCLNLYQYSPFIALYNIGLQQYNRTQIQNKTQELIQAAASAEAATVSGTPKQNQLSSNTYFGVQEPVLAETAADPIIVRSASDSSAAASTPDGSLTKQPENAEASAAPVQKQPDLKAEFYHEGITDYYAKPAVLRQKPNVILIFVEGLSCEIIEDDRNIMPYVRRLQNESISFSNYYNHTFATYMGLSGQLYSGYQQSHYDTSKLISLQDILKANGYHTTFINPEPLKEDFTQFLSSFKFDTLLLDTSNLDSSVDYAMSDKTAYELLFSTASKSSTPFFTAMYSFGTHATLDGIYEQYGDGSLPELNKFYDADKQIETFMEAFKNSNLYDNTVVIITSDHATYVDSDFIDAFPNYPRPVENLDRIPFMIYYKGVSPAIYNVNGRNSLDMAPTVLDLLDMSGENFFLGQSLFAPADSGNKFDTLFECTGTHFTTEGASIHNLSDAADASFTDKLIKYYALKQMD